MMVNEIEKAGIPIVHAASMTPISQSLGTNRIVQCISVPYPFSDPRQSEEVQYQQRVDLVEKCLRALETDISDQTVF